MSEGYEPVVEAFKHNFEEGLEVGSSFAAYVGHELVVELYGGYHNKRYRKAYVIKIPRNLISVDRYDASTLQLVFSSSKFVVRESFYLMS